MDGWLGFNGILSTQVAAISCLKKLKFVSKANGVYKRDYAFSFYRAMHFSAKRGIAIACRLSVCLSVCNVGEL